MVGHGFAEVLDNQTFLIYGSYFSAGRTFVDVCILHMLVRVVSGFCVLVWDNSVMIS